MHVPPDFHTSLEIEYVKYPKYLNFQQSSYATDSEDALSIYIYTETSFRMAYRCKLCLKQVQLPFV